MFIFVFVVVAIDLFIIMIGTAVPTSRLNATLVDDIQHPTAIDVIIIIIHHLRNILLIVVSYRMQESIITNISLCVSTGALLYGWRSRMPTRVSFNWWPCSWPSTFAESRSKL